MTYEEQLKAELATLQRKNRELEAQLAHVYHFAEIGLKTANRASTMCSGILVELHYLGGKEVCPAFVLKDGFSDETIKALQNDISYSYDLTVGLKPTKT